jgi:uncharacterized membrane protein YbhN (UPF0104 family)
MNTTVIKKILSAFLFIGIAGAIFYFMFRRIVLDWPHVAGYSWSISWLSIGLSCALAIVSLLFSTKAVHLLCEVLGGQLPFSRFLYIFCITQLGRYLPGKFWHVLSLAILLERENVKRSVSVLLPLLYHGIMVGAFLLVGIILGGPLVLVNLAPDSWWPLLLFAVVMLSILVFLPFFSRILGRMVNLKYKEVHYLSIPPKGYYIVLGLSLLSGLASSGAFFLFVSGLVEVSIQDAPFIGGIFALSLVIGWVVIIAPGGLGVREGALAILLSPLFSPALGNVIALASRLWLTGVELVFLMGVWLWVRLLRGEGFSFFGSDGGSKGE